MRYRVIGYVWLLVGVIFVTGGLALAAAEFSPRTSASHGVTIKATPRPVSPSTWEFDIAFDTHRQQLTDDLSKTANLVDNNGTSYPPAVWQGDPPGGHHRKGILRFDGVASASTSLELHIQRAGEASPRVFRWETK